MKFWMHPPAVGLLASLLLTLPAVALTPEQQAKEGADRYQSGNYPAAIQAWETSLQAYEQANNLPQIAILLENLARGYQQTGQGGRELQRWDQLIELYRKQQDEPQVGRILTEKAQALSRQGQTQTAIDILCGQDDQSQDPDKCAKGTAIVIARQQQDRKTEAAALGSLGEAYRLRGEYDRSMPVLETSLKLAQQENLPQFQAAALNSLGNTYSSLALNRYRRSNAFREQSESQAEKLSQQGIAFDQRALEHYQQSLSRQDPLRQLRTLTNLIPIHYRLGQPQAAESKQRQAEQLLTQPNLSNSRIKAYAAIDLARLTSSSSDGAKASQLQCGDLTRLSRSETLLQQAATIAQAINDRRAESYALGEMGRIYECRRDYPQALSFSRQAQIAADQNLSTKDSLYLWEWQTARILKAQNKPDQAIVAYERAVATLESIRSDILTANRDIQFDFRDTIDPIYRELVELKLTQNKAVKTVAALPGANIPLNQPRNLKSAVTTIDALKLAELQNYFGNDCIINVVSKTVDAVDDPRSAVINTIMFDDKTAVILTLPNGERKLNWVTLPQATITQTIDRYRIGLESYRDALQGYDTALARQVYDWLIRDFRNDLDSQQIKTLVFVQDGAFRSVPMAALHDGQQFLIENYAIAIAPSLSVVAPKAIDRKNLKVLAVGLSQQSEVDNIFFKPLNNVLAELQGLKNQVPNTKQLVDLDFSPTGLKRELKDTRYSILHIATHGKFGSEPEDTFIVTGDEQARKLNLNQLDNLIRESSKNVEPLDLLMLTACETAIGDDRSTLGLAGVAIQAGASSAIASLWQVNDLSTAQLSENFYGNLVKPEMSRAKALQAAQLKLLKSQGGLAHPYHWSAFVLVGNWL
jgi:CHAT domain-containing protein